MRIRTYPKYTVLKILWKDITSDPSWHSKEGLDKAEATSVVSVGMFLANHKGELKICHDVAEDGSSDYQVIPWGCIDKIIIQKETK